MTQLALTGALVLASVLIGWVAVTAEDRGAVGKDHYRLRAAFADLSNLRKNDDVRIAGRRVGQILDPRVEEGRSVVEVQLDAGLAELPDDTTAIVRAKGLLGARFLELRPGRSAGSLPDGATIPVRRTSATLQLADVIDAFDARTRAGLQASVRGLGHGLAGRGGQVNVMLDQLPTVLADMRSLSAAVLDRRGAAARLAPSLDSAARAFDPARQELADGFEPQAAGLRPFADSRQTIRRLLDVAPSALEGTRAGLARASPVLEQATAFARATSSSLRTAPSALAQARALLAESRGPLRRTAPLMDELRGAVRPTRTLLRAVAPVSQRAREGLDRSIPTLDELAVHACDVRGFASNWRSMLEWGTGGGGAVGPLNVFRYTLSSTPETLPKQGRVGIGKNAYPAPCEAGTEVLP